MKQIALFDRVNLNIVRQQKEVLRLAAKNSHLSREQILDRMNELADDHNISLANNGRLQLHTLEKWLNPSETHRHMPMRALPVFCAVVGDVSAIDTLARTVGCRMITPEDQNLLRWARAYFKARDARREMRRIEEDL